VTYFSILGLLSIYRRPKAINFQKLSMGMTGISGHSLHRGSGAEPIVGGGGEEGFRGFAPPPPPN